MPGTASEWFRRATSTWSDWPAEELVARKGAQRISVVIPARDESATIGGIVTGIRAELVDRVPLVDELVVMDSDSDDATASVAAEAGARVHAVRDVLPEVGWRPGKGEALWKSLFVTGGDLLVFVDADLTFWGPHFVCGLLGPMIADTRVQLVKGFYDRVLDDGSGAPSLAGGRVTELTARPLLNVRWPALSAVVQPLAGEWAIRRAAFEALHVPTGYGVEIATLLDVWHGAGADAVAQVDLGRRAHRHQAEHDLGVMAAEIIAVADARSGLAPEESGPREIWQFVRDCDPPWRHRPVPTDERPPARSIAAYAAGRP